MTDPALLSVVAQSLGAIAEEMSRNLIRSAYSTIVREARDASTVLLTPGGEVVAQGERTIPILLGAFAPLVDGFRAAGVLDGISPGEALITNDAYAGGQHLDDVVLMLPIFDDQGVLGWSASLAHQLDLGAGSPGIHPKAREIYEEGLRIPPLRIDLERELGPGGVLAALLTANIRVPDQTMGDLRAQVAALRTGERRLLGLARRYGRGALLGSMDALLAYTESMMRSAIAEVPDGRYTAEEWMDDDGYSDQPLRVEVTIEVSGDHVHVDCAGTDPQAVGPVNAPLGSTLSTVHTALRYLLLEPVIPANQGGWRPVTIDVPPGTLLNPRFPAAVGTRMSAVFKLLDAMLVAMAPVLPDAVIAPSYSSIAAVALSRKTADGHQLYREAIGGGYGAGPDYDGASGAAITLTNTANTPVEFTERMHPYFMIEGYRLVERSGGGGRFTGGMGVEKTYRILEDDVLFAAYADRHRAGPRGIAGGQDGARGQFLLETDNSSIELPSKVIHPTRRGDRIRVITGGGAGYGPVAQPGDPE
ncbi:MAG: hydantoinase B/oxoprolinase family protein [Acidimicrobiales bacterium]